MGTDCSFARGGGKNGRSMKLSTHPYLVQDFRMNRTVPTLTYMLICRVQWLLIFILDSPESESQQTIYTGQVSWVLVRSVRTQSYVTIPIGGLTALFVFLTTPKTTNPATRPWVSVRPWPTWSGIIRSGRAVRWACCMTGLSKLSWE